MTQVQTVLAQLFQSDTYQIWKDGCLPVPKIPVSTDFSPDGEEWFEPAYTDGIFVGYDRFLQTNAPSSDSIKTVRLRNPRTGQTFWILGTMSDWTTQANLCCGNSGDMPTVTITSPVIIDQPCGIIDYSASVPTYTFATQENAIVTGQKMTLTGNNDGVAFTPTAPGAGFASRDAALTWASANWGAYGTFSAVGTTGIKLVSTTMKRGNINLDLLPQSWCMVIASGDVFRKVRNGGSTFDLGSNQTVSTAAALIVLLKPYFADGTLTAFSATKVQYVGTGAPYGLTSVSDADVRTFSAGVCS